MVHLTSQPTFSAAQLARTMSDKDREGSGLLKQMVTGTEEQRGQILRSCFCNHFPDPALPSFVTGSTLC